MKSKNYKKYKYAYEMGFYTEQMLRMLIGKNGFTEEECEEIISYGK